MSEKKPMTTTQIDNAVRKAIPPLRERLQPPRPKELRASVQHGIWWEVVKHETTRKPIGVLIVVGSVLPKYLKDPGSPADCPLTEVAVTLLEDFCDRLTDQLDVAAQFTWTLGVRDLSTGHLVGLTEEPTPKKKAETV